MSIYFPLIKFKLSLKKNIIYFDSSNLKPFKKHVNIDIIIVLTPNYILFNMSNLFLLIIS